VATEHAVFGDEAEQQPVHEAKEGAVHIVRCGLLGNESAVQVVLRVTGEACAECSDRLGNGGRDHRLPDEHGGGTITVRLHGNNDDAKRKFNRIENRRPIAADDPDFDRLYARRNDAESINRHLDDSLWLGRAHSIGRYRQGLNLLTYALCVNGLALHLHRRRRQPVAA
jgi:hypothetical protein